jgi:hypothetical protein
MPVITKSGAWALPGDTGYLYGGYRDNTPDTGIGDGGNTILLANSYWSDFNGKDERSWQVGYGLDFTTFGVPGLTYNVAYVRGTNIDDGTNRGDGTEREIFNQFKYVVQSGPAKDLSLRARASWLRVSNNASNYNVGGNERRLPDQRVLIDRALRLTSGHKKPRLVRGFFMRADQS